MTRKTKDSGIEWIGKIPENWTISKLKKVTEILTCGYASTPEYFDDGVPFLSAQNVKNDKLDLLKYNKISRELHNQLTKYKKPRKGDILQVRVGATIGNTCIVEDDFDFSIYVSLSHIRVTSEMHNYYLYYILSSGTFINEALNKTYQGGGVGNLNVGQLKEMYIPVPEKKLQEQIASYLNKKCIKIDQTIEKEKQVIEKLKGYKQSIITEAVTKGLNPKVPMKDSVIEWIGDIPEHWEIKRLRYIASCQNGISKSAEYFGTGFPFVSYGDVYRNIELPNTIEGLAESSESDRKIYSVEKGDIFFTRTSETIEEIGLICVCKNTMKNATFAGFLIRVRPIVDNLDLDYSKYYFSSNVHRRFFVKEMNLVTRASLSQELLKKLPVLLPPKEEQKEIGDYLDKKCSKIDNSIAQKQRLIEKLTEYKKSLIYECITGKKEV